MRINCWKNMLSVMLALLLMVVCGSCVDGNTSNVGQSTSNTEPLDTPPEPPKRWRLIVLDEEIFYSQIIEDEEGYPCVPVTCVLVKYGYKITWETDEKARITKGNKVYILNLSKKAVLGGGAWKGDDLLSMMVGGPTKRIVIEKDLLVDRPSMAVLLQLMGESKYYTDLDSKERIVYIGCRRP